MRRVLLSFCWVLSLAACQGHFASGVFSKDGLSYRVSEPGEPWRRVSFADNDLAWASPGGHFIAVNATCEGHEDPPLDVLIQHLLIGFTERVTKERKTFSLDGREALRTDVHAKLDGVERALSLVVLKKNGCVHDFSFIRPLAQEDEYLPQFEQLVAGFAQERAP